MRDAPDLLILFLIPPLILVIGSFALFVLSRASGWSTLTPRYRTEMEPPEPSHHVWWASVGGVSFNNVLRIAGSAQGFYIKVFFPFSLFAPPLLIPWAEIRRTRSQLLGLSWDVLEIGERPVRIRLASKSLQPFEHYLPGLS
jgi:hypothetical protein